ncbi:MAG: 30S ribosomal protein S27ae [Candidatus Micrarchaeota archaeon]|nr:30S ribosomal protein S27ae [Candidatus Micrarchaeota archaeon]
MASKKVNKKGKKVRKGRKHESVKVWTKYEISGNTVKRKNTSCPRCGPGTFLSENKNRKYCGKCGYTEIKKK